MVDDAAPIPSVVAHWDLVAGEAQVLALCVAIDSVAVPDDGEARACAQSLGIPLIGTLGIVLRARKQGLIPACAPSCRANSLGGLTTE